MCSAHHLIVLYTCLKFCENISKGIRVMEWTRICEVLTDGQMDTQNSQGITYYLATFFGKHKNKH